MPSSAHSARSDPALKPLVPQPLEPEPVQVQVQVQVLRPVRAWKPEPVPEPERDPEPKPWLVLPRQSMTELWLAHVLVAQILA